MTTGTTDIEDVAASLAAGRKPRAHGPYRMEVGDAELAGDGIGLCTQGVDASIHVAQYGLSGLHRAHHSVIAPPATAMR